LLSFSDAEYAEYVGNQAASKTESSEIIRQSVNRIESALIEVAPGLKVENGAPMSLARSGVHKSEAGRETLLRHLIAWHCRSDR
jgi:hypothetical protein